MKKVFGQSPTSRVGLAAIILALLTAASASSAPRRDSRKNIVETAISTGKFKTLTAALKAAGLVETLEGKGPFTVFAPTDEAFQKLPPGTVNSLLKPENKQKLISILTYHVVPGRLTASQLTHMKSVKTLNGQQLKVTLDNGSVMVNNATVVKANISCSNGVIHVINAVLLPH